MLENTFLDNISRIPIFSVLVVDVFGLFIYLGIALGRPECSAQGFLHLIGGHDDKFIMVVMQDY
jgi:hypothetical protein